MHHICGDVQLPDTSTRCQSSSLNGLSSTGKLTWRTSRKMKWMQISLTLTLYLRCHFGRLWCDVQMERCTERYVAATWLLNRFNRCYFHSISHSLRLPSCVSARLQYLCYVPLNNININCSVQTWKLGHDGPRHERHFAIGERRFEGEGRTTTNTARWRSRFAYDITSLRASVSVVAGACEMACERGVEKHHLAAARWSVCGPWSRLLCA